MNFKRQIAIALVIFFFTSIINVTSVFGESDVIEEMISITSDWEGSVFYTVGGTEHINATNFEITELEDGKVRLRSSNNRGKISSTDEGIAYYFKSVPQDKDFKLTATAEVLSWTANNQVAFGLMLRGDVLYNVHLGDGGHKGSYVAVGAVNQGIHSFYKNLNSTMQRTLFTEATPPAAGMTYKLTIQKVGNLFITMVGDEVLTIEEYSGEINYAGLFTARNTTVIFSDISLEVDGEIQLGDWQDSFFGDTGGAAVVQNPDNYKFQLGEDNSITIGVYNNRGKIASSTEGIAYYFKEIPGDLSFEIKAKALVNSFTPNNQVSFGLMLRSNVLYYENLSTFTGDYIAVGALDQVIKGFYKYRDSSIQKDGLNFTNVPVPANGEVYDLSIKKVGNIYSLTVNGETKIVNDYSGEINYAGLFVARNAEVVFTDYEIIVETKKVKALQFDTTNMKTKYLIGEPLDLSGLVIKAIYDDNSEVIVPLEDVIVTGFDSSAAGISTITIHYGGITGQLNLEIVPLTITGLDIKYYPAILEYYILDFFDPRGIVVLGNFNNGYKVLELNEKQYLIYVEDTLITDGKYVFHTSGEKTVTIKAKDNPEVFTDFNIKVKNANIVELEIRKLPLKTQYFIGDELVLDGIVVYAKYDDGSQIRLTRDLFEISPLDSTTPGDKTITLTYKGKTANFTVNVKEKEVDRIIVTKYPKTTYLIGEEFDSGGIEISKLYDNGDIEVTKEFSLNLMNYNSSKPGVYNIIITHNYLPLPSIVLPVTVREPKEYQWKSIIFGQSIHRDRNFINVKEDGTIELIALEGGGKITGDHDGISFYYTEIDAADNFVLSADIKVIDYAKNPHDGQESFGIMARDAIGNHMDASVFSSNIAAIGGYSGGTRNPNGTQLFVRTGVISPDGEGSLGIQRVMIKEERPNIQNTYPAQNYRLTLEKNNSGFIGRLNDSQEVIIYEPDILNVQDNKIYVGFYVARLATIEVSNIQFTVTAGATDAPRVDPPKTPIEPELKINSLDRVSLEDYKLMFTPNVKGVVTVRQGQDIIARDIEVEGNKMFQLPTTIAKNALNHFSIIFVPDDTQYLTSYEKLFKNFTVDMRTYREGEDIYVSPTGTSYGDGSRENPLDLDTAIDFVMPGQKIIVLDGHYVRNSKLEIRKYNDGTPDNRKYLVAEEGTRPVIDFDRRSEGVVHSGNYWHVIGLDFVRSAGNTKGYTVGGSYNIIELCRFYENGDTGLQISRTDGSVNIEDWPSYNLILNCTSFDNRDPSENNADGFAAKLTSGVGNVFDGCIAHNNIDDGWDLYAKVGTGAIGAVTIRNSIAFNNGFLTNGHVGAGDKNGFKLGGEGIHVPHIIENSIAFGNLADGFTSNSNPGVILRNNIAFNNGVNLNLYTYTNIIPDFTLDGFVSYHKNNDGARRDRVPENLLSEKNYLFDGTNSINSLGIILTDENFNNLVMPQSADELRNPDGSINFDFLQVMLPQLPEIEEPIDEDPIDIEDPIDGEPVDEEPITEKPQLPEIEEPIDEDPIDIEDPIDGEPVDEEPITEKPPVEEAEIQEPNENERTDGENPETGDKGISIYFLLTLLSGVMLFVLGYKKKLQIT